MSKPGPFNKPHNKPNIRPAKRSAASVRGQRANRRGKRAERLAKWWLRLAGYKILCHNFKTPVGEIDIIAKRAGIICFIEVKMRPNMAAAIGSISHTQRGRIERAAEYFLNSNPQFSTYDIRFDAFVSNGGLSGKLLKDAWRPGW